MPCIVELVHEEFSILFCCIDTYLALVFSTFMNVNMLSLQVSYATWIFTNSLNSLYLLNTQIRHPYLHTNHLNKIILSEMIQMLQQRINIYKVRAHSNMIVGNDEADELAKVGHKYEHRLSFSFMKMLILSHTSYIKIFGLVT